MSEVKVDRIEENRDAEMINKRRMLYVCDPERNTSCTKGWKCQAECFYTSNKNARADADYIVKHIAILFMDAYKDCEVIIKPKRKRRGSLFRRDV